MKKATPFRAFVSEKYMEHRDECAWWNVRCKYHGLSEYFASNKSFLRRAFRESR